MARLEEVCEILDSKRVPITAKDRVNGPYPYYGANGVQDYVADYIFDDELVLLAEDGGHFGSTDKPIAYRVSGKCWVNNHAHVLKPKECINVDYLCYSLMFRDVSDIVNGATRQKLTQADMRKIEIPLLPMTEQKGVVDKIGIVFELIALRKEQLSKLDQLVKSRFIEIFGDPVTNPLGWELRRFDSLCENLDSRRKPITASEREAGIYPYYGASGIVDYVADYLFDEDILLVSEDGANLLMRSTPIAFSVSGKVWVNNHAHVVKFKKMSMQKYIEIFFSLIDISDYITGSAQPKLNQAKLNAMLFPVPNEDRLEAFLVFVQQIDISKFDAALILQERIEGMRTLIQQSLEETKRQFDALMQGYFK